jgi:hypothetical protein
MKVFAETDPGFPAGAERGHRQTGRAAAHGGQVHAGRLPDEHDVDVVGRQPRFDGERIVAGHQVQDRLTRADDPPTVVALRFTTVPATGARITGRWLTIIPDKAIGQAAPTCLA